MNYSYFSTVKILTKKSATFLLFSSPLHYTIKFKRHNQTQKAPYCKLKSSG